MRITPINIILAGLLTWIVWQIIEGEVSVAGTLWLLLLFVVLAAADQIFRILLKSIRKIWLIEGTFILLVIAVLWIIRSW